MLSLMIMVTNMMIIMIISMMIILLIDAGMLSGHSGESHRVALHKVFSPRHFVTLSDGDYHKVIIK